MMTNPKLMKILQERGVTLQEYMAFWQEKERERRARIAELMKNRPDPMEEMADDIILEMAERIGGMSHE